jgi:hypothetical protein
MKIWEREIDRRCGCAADHRRRTADAGTVIADTVGKSGEQCAGEPVRGSPAAADGAAAVPMTPIGQLTLSAAAHDGRHAHSVANPARTADA